MGFFDWLILAGLAVLIAGALFWLRRRKKKGADCCAGCDGACAGCPSASRCVDRRDPNE